MLQLFHLGVANIDLNVRRKPKLLVVVPQWSTIGSGQRDLQRRWRGCWQEDAGLLQGRKRRGRLSEACGHGEGLLLWFPSVWADGKDGGHGCGSDRDGMPRVTW
jgi:hypothetical protein